VTESDCTAVAGDDCCLKQLTEISCVAVVAAGITVPVGPAVGDTIAIEAVLHIVFVDEAFPVLAVDLELRKVEWHYLTYDGNHNHWQANLVVVVTAEADS